MAIYVPTFDGEAIFGAGSGSLVITAARAATDGESRRGPEDDPAAGGITFTCSGSEGTAHFVTPAGIGPPPLVKPAG